MNIYIYFFLFYLDHLIHILLLKYSRLFHCADIIAKEGVQETMVTLVGLIFGMALSHKLGNSTALVWVVFLILTALHVCGIMLGIMSISE